MLSVYYKVWVDAIVFAKSIRSESKNWKIFTIIPISILQGINLLTILLWIRAFSNRKFTVILPVKIFNVVPFNSFIAIIITFFLPFVLINYLLIFNNERYNKLMNTYKSRNGKRYFWYAVISISILAIPYLLKWIF